MIVIFFAWFMFCCSMLSFYENMIEIATEAVSFQSIESFCYIRKGKLCDDLYRRAEVPERGPRNRLNTERIDRIECIGINGVSRYMLAMLSQSQRCVSFFGTFCNYFVYSASQKEQPTCTSSHCVITNNSSQLHALFTFWSIRTAGVLVTIVPRLFIAFNRWSEQFIFAEFPGLLNLSYITIRHVWNRQRLGTYLQKNSNLEGKYAPLLGKA